MRDIIRLFRKIEIDPVVSFKGEPCWTWVGGRQPDKPKKRHGYGIMSWHNKSEYIHRFMYSWLVTPIPPYTTGASIDHLCRNRFCCNPIHLELVPIQINIARGFNITAINARKTHCPQGHSLSGSNLYLTPTNGRCCRICARTQKQVRRQRYKALGLPCS